MAVNRGYEPKTQEFVNTYINPPKDDGGRVQFVPLHDFKGEDGVFNWDQWTIWLDVSDYKEKVNSGIIAEDTTKKKIVFPKIGDTADDDPGIFLRENPTVLNGCKVAFANNRFGNDDNVVRAEHPYAIICYTVDESGNLDPEIERIFSFTQSTIADALADEVDTFNKFKGQLMQVKRTGKGTNTRYSASWMHTDYLEQIPDKPTTVFEVDIMPPKTWNEIADQLAPYGINLPRQEATGNETTGDESAVGETEGEYVK